MECLDNRSVEPSGFGGQGRWLLCEFTKGVLVLLRPTAVDSHRLLEGRVVWGDEQAFFSGHHKDLVAHVEVQAISQVLGEGGTDGATHLAERDSADHGTSTELKGRGWSLKG